MAFVECPERPSCPKCSMGMMRIERVQSEKYCERCAYECLRCGHTETRTGKE
jgi:hypothetical protein